MLLGFDPDVLATDDRDPVVGVRELQFDRTAVPGTEERLDGVPVDDRVEWWGEIERVHALPVGYLLDHSRRDRLFPS